MTKIQTKNIVVKSDQQVFNADQQRSPYKLTPFCFYERMGYPIPIDPYRFAYWSASSVYKNFRKESQKEKVKSFSRSMPSPYLKSFLDYIRRYQRLFAYCPFVQEVYLANSITFNALTSSSDIDIFVIAKEGRVRLARVYMSVIMWILGIKRSRSRSRMRFCLSFFVSSSSVNLESLLLHEKDLYLPYRIAHLVPIYLDRGKCSIYINNIWVQKFLPFWQPEQNICLGMLPAQGIALLRRIQELLYTGWLGDVLESGLQKIRWYCIDKKKNNNPDFHHGVITTSQMLKFHYDQRQYYSDLIFSYWVQTDKKDD